MSTGTLERARSKSREVVPGTVVARRPGELAGTAVRLTLEPTLNRKERLHELLEASGHDSELLGRAWLQVALRSRHQPSRAGEEAEQLLQAALRVEASLLS